MQNRGHPRRERVNIVGIVSAGSLSGSLALCPGRNKQSATRAGEENPEFNWQMKSMRREEDEHEK